MSVHGNGTQSHSAVFWFFLCDLDCKCEYRQLALGDVLALVTEFRLPDGWKGVKSLVGQRAEVSENGWSRIRRLWPRRGDCDSQLSQQRISGRILILFYLTLSLPPSIVSIMPLALDT